MAPAYLQPLIRQYEDNRDPVRAVQMKKYMKDQFEFYGIGTPARRGMMSAHIK
jgi:3-methyladenine DNA glycosylase AlkD